ncbi:hypothetical protein [Methanolapillus millepedarum]|uniref:Uncharacterized protein n=1 Tax=Methanolapillus millepedarum TaxID=3028296 RepID=A0AA96V3K4_9EURY|nr:hypothetical protein MsAc7_10350 [Methanosarcinaceae archaeon Ac7]
MKLKIIGIGIILLISILATGCVGEPKDSLNPLGKDISEFETGAMDNIPRGDGLLWYSTWTNFCGAGFSNETLTSEADLIFYGTVTEVRPSVWSTSDGNTPAVLYSESAIVGKGGYGNETCFYEVDKVSVPGLDEYIYTDVVFEVNDWVKGPQTKDVTIQVQGGQVDQFVMPESYYPDAWDLKVGDKYLVYAKNWGTENYTIVFPGLFVVNE